MSLTPNYRYKFKGLYNALFKIIEYKENFMKNSGKDSGKAKKQKSIKTDVKKPSKAQKIIKPTVRGR
jgi:hypothetical protein